MKINKKYSVAAATAAVSLALLGGTGIAMAAGNGAPSAPVTTSAVVSPEPSTAAPDSAVETADGVDQGPDANATEPGHQDANEANDPAEASDATEGPEAADAAEGPDASDSADGETADGGAQN